MNNKINDTLKNLQTIKLDSKNKNDIINLKNDFIELNNLIDKKCINIYESNKLDEDKIIKYKSLMENMIFEFHKICKEILN